MYVHRHVLQNKTALQLAACLIPRTLQKLAYKGEEETAGHLMPLLCLIQVLTQ